MKIYTHYCTTTATTYVRIVDDQERPAMSLWFRDDGRVVFKADRVDLAVDLTKIQAAFDKSPIDYETKLGASKDVAQLEIINHE